MSRALALSPANETKWTVISGSMAGSVRLMSAAAFTLGRSPDNEFVIINDPKCSRKHAGVQWTERGCEISALTDANPIYLNDKEIERAVLTDDDIVTLGDTKIKFNTTTGTASGLALHPESTHDGQTELAVADPAPAPAPLQLRPHAPPQSAPVRPKSSRKSKKKTDPGRLVIYFVIAIAVLFFLIPSGKKKKNELTLRTEQQIQADIDAANKLQEAGQNLPIKKLDETVTSRQAQENYVRGFRDYRKGQYERSLDSFQACLALDPNHVLCNRYIRLAQRRFSELVQYNIILGRKYRDQNQYKACRAAFQNVIFMVKDANSPAYKEAKANYDACNTMAEGRY